MNICWHNSKYWPKNDDISGTNELQTNRCSFCKTVDDISKPRRKEEKTSNNKYEGLFIPAGCLMEWLFFS